MNMPPIINSNTNRGMMRSTDKPFLYIEFPIQTPNIPEKKYDVNDGYGSAEVEVIFCRNLCLGHHQILLPEDAKQFTRDARISSP